MGPLGVVEGEVSGQLLPGLGDILIFVLIEDRNRTGIIATSI
jgi:hypothetical protein